MKSLIYQNKTTGYKYRYQLPDTFEGEGTEKVKLGVPEDYIDLSKVNWAEFKKALHNSLVENGIKNLKDIRTDGGNRKLQQLVCRQVVATILSAISK